MPSVTIDPGVLAAPSPDSGRDSVYDYIDTLLDWSQLLKEEWIAIYMSERASEVLVEDGLYPLRVSLRDVFNQHGIQEYDYNTVAFVAERLLQVTPHFETVFSIRDVLHETLHTEPNILSIASQTNLRSELARCVILFALLRTHSRNAFVDHALVVRAWCGESEVFVRAVIHDIDHERSDLDTLPELPASIEGAVWVCQSFTELLNGVDEIDIWHSANNENAYYIALHVALHKTRIQQGLEPDWGNCQPFSFGRRFIERANQCFRDNPTSLINRTLRAMVETIGEFNLGAVHALRAGDSGGVAQRMRGEDLAWRRDIDRDYHLHYWKGPNGVEFGWMGSHNDFDLPH